MFAPPPQPNSPDGPSQPSHHVGDEDEEDPGSKRGKRPSRTGGGSGGKASRRRSRSRDASPDGDRPESRGPGPESPRRREEGRKGGQAGRGSGSLEPDEAPPRGGSGEIVSASGRRRQDGGGSRADSGGAAGPRTLTAVADADSPVRGPGRAASPSGSSVGESTDGSIVVPTITASSSVARPSARLSDVLAGKVNSGKMHRGSSGRSQGAVPLLDLRRGAAENGSSGELGSGGSVTAAVAVAGSSERPLSVSRDGDTSARAGVVGVAAGERERRNSSGGGGRAEGGVLTKAYIRKPEAEERRRREERRGSSRRDPNASRTSPSRNDKKRQQEGEDALLKGTPSSSAGAERDSAAAAAAEMEAVTRAARNFNKLYSSGSETGDSAEYRGASRGFRASGKPPEEGGDDDGVAPRSSSASGGAQAEPLVVGRTAEDAKGINIAMSFSSAAKESRASSTAQSDSRGIAPGGDAASRGRVRVKQGRDSSASGASGTSSSSASDGEGSTGGSDGSMSFEDSGSDGSVSFEGSGGGNDDDDDPAAGAGARGRGRYRQSSRSRMRELAYQAARSRSRGSCRSMSSLPRVEEVSEESLSSVSPRPTNRTKNGESGAAIKSLTQESRGPSFDKEALDGDDIPSPFHPLTRDALRRQQGAEEEHRRRAVPPSTAGGDVDDEVFLSAASAVSPSSAPRYAVSGIRMSGNAAGGCIVCVGSLWGCLRFPWRLFSRPPGIRHLLGKHGKGVSSMCRTLLSGTACAGILF